MNQAEASRRIERLEEDLAHIEAEQKRIQALLVKLNSILGGVRNRNTDRKNRQIDQPLSRIS
jgi:hypothetical protein